MSKLNEILKQNKIKQSELADLLSIKSMSTINLKVNGKASFTTDEAKKIKKFINSRTTKQYSIEELF